MSSRILYLGGSYPQRSAVRSLTEASFDIHLTDRSLNPPCSGLATSTYQVDATDKESVCELGQSLDCDGALVGAYGIADYAYASIAALYRLLGTRIPNPDALETMIDKGATKRRLTGAHVPMPRTLWMGRVNRHTQEVPQITCNGIDSVIVKPSRANASTGIARVDGSNPAALRSAVLAAANEGEVVIEEYVEGEIRNLDVLVIDGEVIPISVTRRVADPKLQFLPVLQYQMEAREDPDLVGLSDLANAVVDALDYQNGPFTIDYIATRDGPRLLEVSPHFHSIALEIARHNGNPVCAWFRYLRGDPDWSGDLKMAGAHAGALVMFRGCKTGRFAGLANDALITQSPCLADFVSLKRIGDRIDSLEAHPGLVALAWFTAPTWSMLKAEVTRLMSGVEPIIEPLEGDA